MEDIEAALEEIESLPEAAEDFASSVQEKLESMHEWIANNSHVTPAQAVAIGSMRAGIQKWLDRA